MADYNVLLIRDSPRDEVTRVRSINFMTEAELLLGFGLNLALFDQTELFYWSTLTTELFWSTSILLTFSSRPKWKLVLLEVFNGCFNQTLSLHAHPFLAWVLFTTVLRLQISLSKHSIKIWSPWVRFTNWNSMLSNFDKKLFGESQPWF